MPAIKRQIMVNPPVRTRANGSSDTTNLQVMFPGSPVYKGEITDDTVTDTYMSEVTSDEIDDGGHTFGTVQLDYQGAPNLAQVVVGGGGLPGSPYAPNIAVPPEGQNPADIPEAGVAATEAAKGSGGPFNGDGMRSPHLSSNDISRQTVGSLQKGRSTPVGGLTAPVPGVGNSGIK